MFLDLQPLMERVSYPNFVMGLFEHWSKHVAFVVQIEDVVMSVINNNQGYNDMPPLRLYIKGAAGYS